MPRLVLTATAAVLVAPGLLVVVLALVVGAVFSAACPASAVMVGPIPDQLQTTAADGSPVRLDRTQLGHAATIIATGSRTAGVGRDGVLVALMAGLTESGLRMFANTTAYPQSAAYPHDGDGHDHDSLGIFQMRPAAGWGTVAELMDPTYQAQAFFGGPDGPNHGSPRGLLDIPHWRDLPAATAAQAVEVSAYPSRYARYEPVAAAILTALTTPTDPAADGVAGLPHTSQAVFPLPEGTWSATSRFGMRVNPVTHVWALHAGVDLAAAAGTPVLATADGRVVAAGPGGGLGNRITLLHPTGTVASSGTVASVYGHLLDGGIHVDVGDVVRAGQHIGDVGSTGNSTNPHLHFELRPGDPGRLAIDPQPWLDATTQLTGDHLLPASATQAPVCPGLARASEATP
ncbi:M23 family metallopeptidase [Pengzhenrongella sicca]|uniref:M23 family metallopeptidase n=1 Tax=Pengzhenrongella sicca TaxID=2819238 RepID=A0A8A4ZDQ6_9MICO|nr:M23 family metallopeptidase [Pengzhenrongella sicca]QTE28617.1 M23 family metallopeptidase [Pengzhenrongella sicca]